MKKFKNIIIPALAFIVAFLMQYFFYSQGKLNFLAEGLLVIAIFAAAECSTWAGIAVAIAGPIAGALTGDFVIGSAAIIGIANIMMAICASAGKGSNRIVGVIFASFCRFGSAYIIVHQIINAIAKNTVVYQQCVTTMDFFNGLIITAIAGFAYVLIASMLSGNFKESLLGARKAGFSLNEAAKEYKKQNNDQERIAFREKHGFDPVAPQDKDENLTKKEEV